MKRELGKIEKTRAILSLLSLLCAIMLIVFLYLWPVGERVIEEPFKDMLVVSTQLGTLFKPPYSNEWKLAGNSEKLSFPTEIQTKDITVFKFINGRELELQDTAHVLVSKPYNKLYRIEVLSGELLLKPRTSQENIDIHSFVVVAGKQLYNIDKPTDFIHLKLKDKRIAALTYKTNGVLIKEGEENSENQNTND